MSRKFYVLTAAFAVLVTMNSSSINAHAADVNTTVNGQITDAITQPNPNAKKDQKPADSAAPATNTGTNAAPAGAAGNTQDPAVIDEGAPEE